MGWQYGMAVWDGMGCDAGDGGMGWDSGDAGIVEMAGRGGEVR